MDAETLCHFHFTDVWISTPPVNCLCWIFFCFWAPADKTCRQQRTSLADRAPCSQQGNPGVHSSHTLFMKCYMEKRCLCATDWGWKTLWHFSEDPPTHSCLFFSKQEREHKVHDIVHRDLFRFLAFLGQKNCVLASDIKKWKGLIEYKFEFSLICISTHHLTNIFESLPFLRCCFIHPICL